MINLKEKEIESLFRNVPIVLKLYRNIKDRISMLLFLCNGSIDISIRHKFKIIRKLLSISKKIECPHTNSEILSFIETILLLNNDIKGPIIEAGCFKGGSTSKFSIAAKIAQRKLLIFDSFEGIPEHSELHTKNIYGKNVTFVKGEYCGPINEVKSNVNRHGNIEVCKFIKGWFEETMPHYADPIAAIYIDVDLAASVKTCLKYLYPLLEEGGVLYCQDGHLPLVIDIFGDDNFWLNEVGFKKPLVEGLGQNKLIRIVR